MPSSSHFANWRASYLNPQKGTASFPSTSSNILKPIWSWVIRIENTKPSSQTCHWKNINMRSQQAWQFNADTVNPGELQLFKQIPSQSSGAKCHVTFREDINCCLSYHQLPSLTMTRVISTQSFPKVDTLRLHGIDCWHVCLFGEFSKKKHIWNCWAHMHNEGFPPKKNKATPQKIVFCFWVFCFLAKA